MESLEANKHAVRTQTLKSTEHIREARQALALAFEHLKFIRNAGQIKGLESIRDKAENYGKALEALYNHLDVVFKRGINLTCDLKDLMEQPDHHAPPIEGRYLRYTDLTAMQRWLVREGHQNIADNSKYRIPETYYNKADHEPKPAKILSTDKIKYVPSKKRPPDSRMPL